MTIKPDYPPLLFPGLHQISIDELRSIAVDAFPNDLKRADLFSRFMAWRKAAKALGLSGRIWLDGSFLTSKPDPDDIDMVTWDVCSVNPLTDEQIAHAHALFEKASCRVVYGLDIYLEVPTQEEAFHREAYWKGLLGFCHDRVTAKGFAEVVL